MLIVINKETIIGWPCRQGKIVSDCQICQRGNLNWKSVLQMRMGCGVRVH